ncbi:MAG: DUF4346 domain-containing protein [Hormoscilla sp. SP12CHS1]|nr:DUF4346 domain-containing protein [Hormoscilla sp. SP12CHS1]
MTATIQATQFHYKALYKPNQLIYGTGQTAVVTGWTVKQAVAKHLHVAEFAAIGQLYSPTRGISLLIRNMLANPHVRFLVVLNATKEDRNAGGIICLLDFFRNGFTEGKSDTNCPCWLINSPIHGYIDIKIDPTILLRLRESVEWKEVSSIAEAVSQVKLYAQRGVVAPWGLPQEFPLTEIRSKILPGPRYGHRIECQTIAQTWVKIIHRIRTTGTLRPTGYDGQWQELIDLMAVVTDEPHDFYFPEPNYLPVDRAFIQEYIPQILDDAPYREGVKYTYGQRLRSWFGRDQIEQVIAKLIGEIDAASAVMSLWDVQDYEKGGSPCLNHIWVRVVNRELSLTATIRSNDMYMAWPANAIGLRALQQYIRDAIASRSDYDLNMGPLITVSQSAHLYDDTFENADRLIKTQYAKICQQRDYHDPTGNFVITLESGKIMVEQMTPGTVPEKSGEVVNCYEGRSALSLYRQIAADCQGMEVEHAMYLGTELQKAEIALSRKQVYEQDKPLS